MRRVIQVVVLVAAVVVGSVLLGQAPDPCSPTDPFLTHSTNLEVVAGNSVSCNSSGVHNDNSYWRTFALGPLAALQAIEITSVEIGIELSIPAAGTDTLPLFLRLYADADDNPAPTAELDLLYEESYEIPEVSLELYCLGLASSVVVPVFDNGEEVHLVVEVFTPGFVQTDLLHVFFLGLSYFPK